MITEVLRRIKTAEGYFIDVSFRIPNVCHHARIFIPIEEYSLEEEAERINQIKGRLWTRTEVPPFCPRWIYYLEKRVEIAPDLPPFTRGYTFSFNRELTAEEEIQLEKATGMKIIRRVKI